MFCLWYNMCVVILVVPLLMGIVSCDDEEQGEKEHVVFTGVRGLSHTDCKTTTKSLLAKEYLELEEQGKYLTIKHINAMFNCCPKEFLVTSRVSNDTIFINENEKEAICDCICPYDLSYKIGALNYGNYHVILSQMDSNTILLEFDLNFKLGMTETVNIKH